jgi:hypothetical protein
MYRNSSACEEKMRSTASTDSASSAEIVKITHTGASGDGSRVVVEGTVEHDLSPAEAASAPAPAPVSASTSGLLAPVAAALNAHKPKKVIKPAAVECTFTTAGLNSFRWLAPPELAKTTEESGAAPAP